LFNRFSAYIALSVSLNSTTLTASTNSFPQPLTLDSGDFAELTTDAWDEPELSLGATLGITGSDSSYVAAPHIRTTVLRV
jgi:hypothetical protein